MTSTHAREVIVGGIDGIAQVTFSNTQTFSLMAGPCVIESRDHAMEVSHALVEMTQELGIGLIYKSSFDKANRTSIHGHRGLGLEKGLQVLADVKERFQVPIVTDVHLPEQCAAVGKVADLIQIPAFLCRQTDLLLAAAETERPINVKKGQFMAPWDMAQVVKKLVSAGNDDIMLCERGVSFGYNTLVNDMRSLPIMAEMGFPVIFDATHSVQKPAGAGASTGGDRRFVEPLARAAVAVGVAGLFIETHPNPDQAPSDGPNMVVLKEMPKLLRILKEIDDISKQHPVDMTGS